MNAEQTKALAAYEAMKAGGAKGGAAGSGDAKRRSPEQYAAISRRAAIKRAEKQGKKLYEVRFAETQAVIRRVIAANKTEAKKKVRDKLKKALKNELLMIEEISN